MSLYHVGNPECPPGAREMMSDINRVGCANNRACPNAQGHLTSVRAVFHVRIVDADTGAVRFRYLCATCAAAFAVEHELPGAATPTEAAR